MSNNIAELVGTISDAVELEGGIVALRGLKGEKGEKGDPSDAALEGVQVPYGDDNEWQDVSVVQKKARIPVASSTGNGVTSIERYGSEVDIAHGNNDPAYGLGAQHYSLPLVMHDVEGYEEGTIDPNLIPSSVFAKPNVYTAKAYLGRVDLTNYSATIQDFEFSGEMLLVVKFTSISTTPTGWSLNVNNSGSKAIYYNGSNSVDFTKLITTDSLVGLVKDPDNIGFAIAFISTDSLRGVQVNGTDLAVTGGKVNIPRVNASTSGVLPPAGSVSETGEYKVYTDSYGYGEWKLVPIGVDSSSDAPARNSAVAYELNRKQDTLTATSPIDIDSNNDISHEDSGVVAGTYDGGDGGKQIGFYIPSFTVDAKGHITSATDLGTLIPSIGSSTGTLVGGRLVDGYSWRHLPQMASTYGDAYILYGGETSRTYTLRYLQPVNTSDASYMRLVNVEAIDVSTGESVIVDWSVDYPTATSGKSNNIKLTVSIAEAYEHAIVIHPMVAYGNAGM